MLALVTTWSSATSSMRRIVDLADVGIEVDASLAPLAICRRRLPLHQYRPSSSARSPCSEARTIRPMTGRIRSRLEELGLVLHGPHPPHDPLDAVVIHGGTARTSGQLPRIEGQLTCIGTLGDTVSVAEGSGRRGGLCSQCTSGPRSGPGLPGSRSSAF